MWDDAALGSAIRSPGGSSQPCDTSVVRTDYGWVFPSFVVEAYLPMLCSAVAAKIRASSEEGRIHRRFWKPIRRRPVHGWFSAWITGMFSARLDLVIGYRIERTVCQFNWLTV